MKNRDMFYQNLNQGYSNPGTFIQPSGYNLNQQYQVYGNNIPNNYNNPNYIEEDNQYEQRITRLEKQYKNLDSRLSKLENLNTNDDNLYMI